MKQKSEKLTLTAKEAAESFGVSLPVMYEIVKRDDFPVIRVGRKVIIPIDRFREWVNRQSGQVLG